MADKPKNPETNPPAGNASGTPADVQTGPSSADLGTESLAREAKEAEVKTTNTEQGKGGGAQAASGTDPIKDAQAPIPDTTIAEASTKAPPLAASSSAGPGKGSLPPAGGDGPHAPKGRSGAWLSFLLSLILLAALAGGGYYLWDIQQGHAAQLAELQSQQQNQQQAAARNLDSLRSDLQQSRDAVAEEIEALSQQGESLAELQSQLSALRQRVLEMASTTTDDWKLAEAHYLLRLAGQRLVMERNPTGALALLESADHILREQNDPELFPLRRILAEDIAALRLVETIDREGLYLQLAALTKQIANLPLTSAIDYAAGDQGNADAQIASTNNQASTSADEEPQSGAVRTWARIQRSFNRALRKLRDFVRVTHHDEIVQALPAPALQNQLRQRVQLEIELAQLALMREEQTIYQRSLEQAQQSLREAFPKSTSLDRIIEQLQSAHAQNVIQELPSINRSQQALGEYLNRLHRLAPEANSQ